MKLSTADCQKWLVANKAEDVKASHCYEEADQTPEDKAYSDLIAKNAVTPGKWKRMTKYNIGSAIDKGEQDCAEGGYAGMNYHERYASGVVRTFYLEDTDHVTYNLIEVDGVIVEVEDFSD